MPDSSSAARLRGMQHEYHPSCAVCGQENLVGFGLDFQLLEDLAVQASFTCDQRFQGYRDWLHGGAIAAILDGAMTNCLFARGLVAVTADLRVRFRQPLPTGSEATVRAWVERSLGPLHTVAAEIVQCGRVAASASGTFVEYNPQRLGTLAGDPGNQDPAARSTGPHLAPTPATGAGPAPGPGGNVTGQGCRQAPIGKEGDAMTQATEQTHGSAALDPLFGWLDHPTVNASLTGLCGDQVEFYLDIRQGVIADLRYYSEGCDYLRSCAAAVARRAKGMAILDALAISPRAIIEAHEGLPEKGRHCAILAVSTLYRAIAAYLLDQQAIRERAGAG